VALADLTIREIGNHNVYKCNIYQTLRMSTEYDVMGAIVIRTRYDEGTESVEVATSGIV
jgi:hypothetical protein